jgi:hypothetical protein
MRYQKDWTGLERRSSERIYDHSLLKVRGLTEASEPFEETARIKDVSSDGISFYLKTQVRLKSNVDLEISSTDPVDSVPAPLFSGRARVLRVSVDDENEGVFLTAARFLEPLLPLRKVNMTDEMAEELQRAIQLDEEARRAYPERF